ncbi:MAG: UDP-N-acetylmuramoyl-L-alanyl-D-glutamate--2,6-diaminopimelate ligase [Bacteroidetes bacterium]|nr:UDP-N-acetylmuramoyl-L-alanyl-D-glutamate--2,6-diaminopimelate ligase [Bacteroidota bacterium]
MKKISDIINNTGVVEIIGDENLFINSISFDSRKIEANSLFIAIKGIQFDGHQYISETIKKGAIAIVCEDLPENLNTNITYIKVKNSSYALGEIASNFYENPSKNIKLVGITGTNGKTTTVTLLFNLFRNLGYNVGLLSTISNRINDNEIASTHTTPDAIQLNALLKQMVEKGCSHCFMEVSSHAIIQNRIAGITFSGAIFSNITHDHLDFHKTFAEYIKAKKIFFDKLSNNAFALTNIDDKNGKVMIQNTKASKYSYSLQTMADFKCRIIENELHGLFLNIDGIETSTKLVGNFNAYNILAVYATAILLGEDKIEVLKQLSNLNTAEGRFEYIKSKNNITAIVDYAHTPDALLNVLNTIETIRTKNEQLITVVGAGGNRDAQKRPVMAKIACEMSDILILTSDNPRDENPEDILHQMEEGIDISQKRKVLTILNRKEAIKTACAMAKSGDIILIAGKGHEKYQEIKGIKHHFDDKEILIEFL